MSIVAKFGGSSVRDGEAMKRCAQIVKSFPETRLVIISATYNTTNQLEQLAELAASGNQVKTFDHLKILETKHFDIAKDLNANEETLNFLKEVFFEAKGLIDTILKDLSFSKSQMDQIYSIGERLSSSLFTHSLSEELPSKKAHYFDVRKVLITDEQYSKAIPNIERISKETEVHLKHLFEDENNIIVTQGFVGCSELGKTTTLGREGSDFSATLLAEALGADLVQIWTDVPGIFTADPKVDIDAKVIPKISYDQATKMAKEGAKILFPKTLLPAKRKNIPVFIGSSLEPKKGGSYVGNLDV